MNVRVLVTGAAGFLGRSVCQRLLSAGAEVVALSRSTTHVAGVEHCNIDLTNPSAVATAARALGGVTRVIHLASPVPGVSSARTLLVDAERIFVGFMALVAELPAVEHVTYLSSVAVYGTGFKTPPTEESPLPVPTSAYPLHKKLAEDRIRQLSDAFGWSWAALRSTQVYGPGEPHGLGLTRMLKTAVSGQRCTLDNGGEDERDLMFVDDVAAAVANVSVDLLTGVINISSGQGVRIATLAAVLHELLDGSFDLDVRPVTRERTSLVYDNSRMKEVLGVKPSTSIRDGVRACIEWELAHRGGQRERT